MIFAAYVLPDGRGSDDCLHVLLSGGLQGVQMAVQTADIVTATAGPRMYTHHADGQQASKQKLCVTPCDLNNGCAS
jgi:hypothetical protein